jgi:hypothetical protein
LIRLLLLTMQQVKFLFLLFLSACLFSCSPTVKNVTGIYLARHNKGLESIEFKPDSTYLHTYKPGAEIKKQSGKWKLNEDNLIIIYDWITYVSPKENDPALNNPATVVIPYNDNAIIMYAEDEDYNFYRK